MLRVIDRGAASVKITVFFISMWINYFSKKPFVLNAIYLQHGANQWQRRFCAEIDRLHTGRWDLKLKHKHSRGAPAC